MPLLSLLLPLLSLLLPLLSLLLPLLSLLLPLLSTADRPTGHPALPRRRGVKVRWEDDEDETEDAGGMVPFSTKRAPPKRHSYFRSRNLLRAAHLRPMKGQ